jgi:arginyl-tRNA synthetase
MKAELTRLLLDAVRSLEGKLLTAPVDPTAVTLERPRDASHGDFASNIALRLAKSAGKNPREVASAIVAALPANKLIDHAEVAGAGFINFKLRAALAFDVIRQVLTQGAGFGRAAARSTNRKVLVEFVSANPTGPMHVGHGRQAAFGDALARILDAGGYEVTREYYINDAGRQMDILAVSLWLRYLEACGESIVFPQNGYRGDYLLPVAAQLRQTRGTDWQRASAEIFRGLPTDAPAGDKEKHIDAIIERARTLLGSENFQALARFGCDAMLAEIRDDLSGFGVHFDVWSSEREFLASGAIDAALARLRAQGLLYEKDGAQWFRATQFGDDEDRVVVRENGVNTYFAADIAYHDAKRRRGFDQLIDVLGADHHGYVARVRGGLMAFGHPGECLDVRLIQLVSLFRDGVKLAMGKREATFVTLRQLREEVGNDSCRLFYLMRSNDQALDFDLELAKKKSEENPVFYLQYAHARVSSVARELQARALSYDANAALAALGTEAAGDALAHEQAQVLLKSLARYPEVIMQAAEQRAPHVVVHYLRELATGLHSWYNGDRWLVADDVTRHLRLALAFAVQQVLRNGLSVLGATAPESM